MSAFTEAATRHLAQVQAALHSLDVTTAVMVGLALVVVYLTWEQMSFAFKHRSRIPGPSVAVPIVGGIFEMVMDPYGFWERQREYTNTAAGGLHAAKMSWNSILGNFMIYSTNTAVSRKILSNNGPDSLMMAVHPSGKIILGEKNLAFMHGAPHKAIRKSFLALFTRTALAVYIERQDKAIRCGARGAPAASRRAAGGGRPRGGAAGGGGGLVAPLTAPRIGGPLRRTDPPGP